MSEIITSDVSFQVVEQNPIGVGLAEIAIHTVSVGLNAGQISYFDTVPEHAFSELIITDLAFQGTPFGYFALSDAFGGFTPVQDIIDTDGEARFTAAELAQGALLFVHDRSAGASDDYTAAFTFNLTNTEGETSQSATFTLDVDALNSPPDILPGFEFVDPIAPGPYIHSYEFDGHAITWSTELDANQPWQFVVRDFDRSGVDVESIEVVSLPDPAFGRLVLKVDDPSVPAGFSLIDVTASQMLPIQAITDGRLIYVPNPLADSGYARFEARAIDSEGHSGRSGFFTIYTFGTTAPYFFNVGSDTAVSTSPNAAPILLDNDIAVFDAEMSIANNYRGDYRGAQFVIHRSGSANADDAFALNLDRFAQTSDVPDTFSGLFVEDSSGVIFQRTPMVGGGFDDRIVGRILSSPTASNTYVGELTISFSDGDNGPATPILRDDVDALLQSIQYVYLNAHPDVDRVALDYTFEDNGSPPRSDTQTLTVMIESNDPPSVVDIVATGNGSDNRLAVVETAGNGTFVGILEALDASGNVIPGVSFEIVDENGAVVPPEFTPFRVNGSQIVVDIDGANDLLSYNVDASLTVNVRAVLGDGTYQEPVPISVWFNSGCNSAGNYFRVSLDIADQYDWAETVYIYAGGPDGPLIDVQQLNDDGSSQRTLYGTPDFLVQTITMDTLGRETDRWTVYDDTQADRTLRDPGQIESSYETYTQYFERIGGTWQIYDEYGVRDGGDASWRTRNDLSDVQDWQQIYEEFAINGPDVTRTRETVLYDDGHIVTTLF